MKREMPILSVDGKNTCIVNIFKKYTTTVHFVRDFSPLSFMNY